MGRDDKHIKILVEKPEGENHLKDSFVDAKILIERLIGK
jgi:hypothetical protein